MSYIIGSPRHVACTNAYGMACPPTDDHESTWMSYILSRSFYCHKNAYFVLSHRNCSYQQSFNNGQAEIEEQANIRSNISIVFDASQYTFKDVS